MKIILDAHKLENAESAHEYLKEELDFPDYYGKNLDALYDCLNDLADMEIVFRNCETAGGYFEKVFRVFEKACEENAGLLCSRD